MRAIDDARPNSRNVRTHSKKQLGQIATSVEKFGFLNPILVDETGMVLAGHGRLEAARLLGISQVPVVVITHLSDAEKRAYVLADNKLAENAGWDREMLAIELGDLAVMLPDINLDIGITGFSAGELDSLLLDHAADERDPVDTVEFQKDRPVTSKRGDLWQMRQRRGHRLLCGDARSGRDMERLNNGAVVAMAITDPPYNVRVNGHVGGRGKIRHQEFAFASGDMSPEEYRAFLTEAIRHMVSASSGGGLVYIFIDWRHVEVLLQTCRALGLELRNLCVWHKSTPGQGSFYRSAHELIVVCQIPGGQSTNNIELGRHGRNRSNVWSYPGVNTFRVGNDDELALHPTVKPMAMIAEAIKDASARGAIVLDPFLGSGTTLLACEKVGRRCHGIEYEPRYVDVAIRRWQQFTGQDAILIEPAADLAERQTTSLTGLTFDEIKRIRSSAQDQSADKTSPTNTTKDGTMPGSPHGGGAPS